MKVAIIETEKGTIELELFEEDAPNTVANFEKLIEEAGKDIPLDVIEMKDYGMMNGKAVYEFAKKLLNK